ncbi:MAG: hypothetical protein AUH91_03660 [Verrucomicrobia bacterium 13_1_40CM_4_54_4]|nr:MAG: hypothetical protein AUH91_03660 [Verrucomicrobia bacterium 13_1_40CM_4_54_4]
MACTGFAWAKPAVWERMRPVIPTFTSPDVFEAWEQEHEPHTPARAAWFSPGGFQAYEHYWALPAAVRFHQNIGPSRVTARIHELNSQMKEALARMPHVELYTRRPYRISYARVACSIVNTPREVDMVVRAIHELA